MALVISLLFHLAAYGTYKGGQKLGLWDKLQRHLASDAVNELKASPTELANVNREPPLMFVDVNASAPTEEPTTDTPYYSDKSSRASNPLTDEETDQPMVDGTQEQMVRTENVLPPLKPVPLQPSAPPSEPKASTAEKVEPETQPDAPKGDLQFAKAEEPKESNPPKPPEVKPRPRTLKEAMARLPQDQADALAGRKMKQSGGVRRLSTSSFLDVKASPFGEYDRAIIVAIQNRWFDLLDMRGFGHEKSGKVVLDFRLHHDGRISQMTVAENTVDEMLSLLCQKAVLDPSPYARWPSDMRRMIGEDYRDVRFTFYYN